MPMKRPSPRLLLRLIRFASHRRDSRVPRAKPQLQSRRPRWHGRLRPPLASLARRLSCRQGCCARPRGKAPKNFACGANTLPFFWPAAQRSPQNFRLRRRFSPTKIPFTLPLDAANPSRRQVYAMAMGATCTPHMRARGVACPYLDVETKVTAPTSGPPPPPRG